jgi:peroxiredoxin (alkyl hydroperoxide reductase subunit C)
MLSIGQMFPTFQLAAVHSSDKDTAFRDVSHKDYAGQWKIIFFWPKDFTFVCPTEIVGFGKLNSEFQDRNAQLLGVSTDSEFVHLAWRQHHTDLKDSPFPWLADIKKELSHQSGILDQNTGVANRATFIVDPNNIIRHVSVNDGKVGRNPNEILRVLDALQTDELCPCNWKQGEETLNV